MKILLIVAIFLHATSANKEIIHKCCENEKNLLVNRGCDVNSEGHRPKLKLECEEKYILDPTNVEEDAYNITQNGTLYVPDMQSYLLPDE